ncbi:hypothetical protein VitviT2T_028968 [Vitis vinifera]|uniref:Uncharacterized protein n=1 Tax=Vitis vinifera TaxID=29760 RepID=A0ABY9DWM0_VITVI|nr:hypothetical protein VitviT2T_028968 [Vitis vinifera]
MEQQVSQSCSGGTVGISLSDGNQEKTAKLSDGFGSTLHQNGMQENTNEGFLTSYKDHQRSSIEKSITLVMMI